MLQGFDNMLPFINQLLIICQKLPLAAPAKIAVGTGRGNSKRRGFDQINHPGLGIIFFLFINTNIYTVSGYCLVDEHRHAVQPHQAPAAEDNICNFNIELLTLFNFHD